MSRIARIAVLTLALGLILTACSSGSDADGSWEVTQMRTEAGELASPVGVQITLVVDDGSFAGNAGCNNYFGDVSVDEPANQVGTTLMMCESNIMVQESLYLSLLGQVADVSVSGDEMVATDGSGTTIIVYNRIDDIEI